MIGRTVEGIFFFELLMMVLPYLLLFNSLLLAGFLYFILFKHYSFVSFKVGIPFFLLLAVTVAMGYWIYDFSYTKEKQSANKEVLKVAFFNKLYENKNYNEMHKSIKTSNPDVIGLSEVTKEDLEHVTFRDSYPFMYKKPYRGYYLLMLSKYPLVFENIHNAPHAFAAKGKIRGEQYTFVVTHPFAVLNKETLLGRNKELQVLHEYAKSLHDTNLVLLGDMNTSPWSSSYVKFTSNVNGLKDAAKGAGLSTTWKAGPLITQIDHILVSQQLQVQSYKSIFVQGSDHYLQLATLSSRT